MRNRPPPLPFEPKYHRRINRSEFVSIKDIKPHMRADQHEEHAVIEQTGFTIIDEQPQQWIEIEKTIDKGDVAGVIAKTNPEFQTEIMGKSKHLGEVVS